MEPGGSSYARGLPAGFELPVFTLQMGALVCILLAQLTVQQDIVEYRDRGESGCAPQTRRAYFELP